jgi:hypothetical protein
MGERATLPTLLTEAEAYERFGHVLEDKELRRAREGKELGYYVRKGRIFYNEAELLAYIAASLKGSYHAPCQSSASGNTGSTPSPDQPATIASGMTPDLVRSAGALLRQRILSKQRSSSPRSSSPKAKLRLVTQDK